MFAEPHATSLRPPWPVPRRCAELAASAALLIAGLFFAWQASLLDFGRVRLPGPGFLPFVLGVVLAGIALVIAIGLTKYAADGAPVEVGHRDVVIALAGMLAVPVTFERLGAYATLGVFFAALLKLIGRVSPLTTVAAAAISMALVWYFFHVLLGLQLPKGPF